MLQYLIVAIAWQFRVLCFGKTFEQQLRVDDNGDLTNSSTVARCSSGQKIELLSYKYEKRRCPSGNTCDIDYEGSFSPDAELLLQEMCSLQEVCSDLRFPLRSDLQRNHQPDTVNLEYGCLDSNAFIDICDDTEVSSNTTIHITSSSNATAYRMCKCSVYSNDKFSVEQREIRLKIKNESSCSPAVVIFKGLRSSSLVCNESREDFGFINNVTFAKSAYYVVISLILNSNDTLPGMVWITVKPQKGTATLKCQPILRPSFGTAQENSAPPAISSKNSSAFASIWFVPLMTGIAVAFVMLLACLIFILIYKRRQEKDERANSAIKNQPQTLPQTEHSGRKLNLGNTSQKNNSSQLPKTPVAGLKKSTTEGNLYFEINIYDADSEYCNNPSVDIQANRAIDNPYYGEEEYDTGTLSKKKPKRNPQYDHVDSVTHQETASVSKLQSKRVHINKNSF